MRALFRKDVKALNALVDCSMMGIIRISISAELPLTYCNDVYLELSGLQSAADLASVNNTSREHFRVPASYVDYFRSVIITAALKGEKHILFNYPIINKEKQTRWTYCYGRFVRDKANEQEMIGYIPKIEGALIPEDFYRFLEQDYHMANDLGGKYTFIFDFQSKQLTAQTDISAFPGLSKITMNFPEDILHTPIIAAEHKGLFCAQFASIVNGKPFVQFDCRITGSDGKYYWTHIESTTIFDKNLKPLRAVITGGSLESAVDQRDWDRIALAHTSSIKRISIEVNLSQNQVHQRMLSFLPSPAAKLSNLYSAFIQTMVEHYVDHDDQPVCQIFFNRERLLSCFAEEKFDDSLEFHMMTGDNQEIVRSSVHLFEAKDTGDKMATFVLTGIDDHSRALEQFTLIAIRDPLTQVSTRMATEWQISDALRYLDDNEMYALFIIDLDNFKQVNDKLGHQQGDHILISVVNALSAVFRPTDILGRLGGDEFMVFISGQVTPELVRSRANDIITALQFSISQPENIQLSASIGVVIGTGAADFNRLYRLADAAMYTSKRSGKNCYHIVEENELRPMEEPQSSAVNAIHLQTLLQYMDGGVALFAVGDSLTLLYHSPGYALVAEQEQGSNCADNLFAQVLPCDRCSLSAILYESAEKGDPIETTIRAYGKDSNLRWVQFRVVRIPYEGIEQPVVIAVTVDVTRLKEQEAALRESSERIRVTFNKNTHTLWEVNIPQKTFAVLNLETRSYEANSIFHDVPESLISNGFAHPFSKRELISFFDRMLGGCPEDSVALILRYFNSPIYGWAKISYHTLFDDNGNPIKAVGVFEELPDIFNEQSRFHQEQLLMETLQTKNIETLVANLTTDTISTLSSQNHPGYPLTMSYSALIQQYIDTVFSQEDKLLCEIFLRKKMINAYNIGSPWVESEYRQRNLQGEIRWVSSISSLLIDPVTRELYVFFFKRDVNERRYWELSLPCRVERDSVTRLYSRSTTEALIRHLLHEYAPTSTFFAMAMVEIDGFNEISASNGHHIAATLRFTVCRFFRLLLDQDSVVGQLSNNRILIFWPNVMSDLQAKTRMEETVSAIQKSSTASGLLSRVHFTIGIATLPAHQATYESLFTRASYVCHQPQGEQQDCVLVFDNFVNEIQSANPLENFTENTLTNSGESLNLLNPEEKDTLLTCMLAILSSTTSSASIKSVFEYLGAYYNADCVYQLSFSDETDILNLLFEWSLFGKQRLVKQFSNVPIGCFPAIEAAANKMQPIVMQSSSPRFEQSEMPEHPGVWHYICVPMIKEEQVYGFLCVENPRNHSGDTSLLSILSPILLMDFSRRRSTFGGETDSLTGLQDPISFQSRLASVKSDVLSSLGVLHIDINGLHGINLDHGYEYGNELILFAARTLSDIFSYANAYRASGHSFASLCSDVTHAAFLDKCSQAQTALDQQYPGRFSVGYTWADKDIVVRRLAEHAESIMNYNKQSYYRSAERIGKRDMDTMLKTLQTDIQLDRYRVYLQPKNNLTTGQVVGAEALVRFFDPLCGIVPPVEFIHRMEEHHIIRELDLFMLDRSLQILQTWQTNGYTLVPISVNFSRQTLLDRSSLEATLAILHKYTVPVEYIEIEITESLGMIERQTIAHAVAAFREKGFQFSLDDFGSEYSSIGMLSEIVFDSVKLDKSIINHFVTNRVNLAIVESMIEICRVMGAVCIAEGVETIEQVEALKTVGCDYAQGYFYNKPLPVHEFEQQYIVKESMIPQEK